MRLIAVVAVAIVLVPTLGIAAEKKACTAVNSATHSPCSTLGKSFSPVGNFDTRAYLEGLDPRRNYCPIPDSPDKAIPMS